MVQNSYIVNSCPSFVRREFSACDKQQKQTERDYGDEGGDPIDDALNNAIIAVRADGGEHALGEMVDLQPSGQRLGDRSLK